MKFQSIFNLLSSSIIIALVITVFNLQNRLQQTEIVVKDGGVHARFITTQQVSVLNANGLEIIKLDSDRQDSSGYGDGIVLVNEGQGLKNQAKKIQASVQIRANAQLGGMVAAQSYRLFKTMPDGRMKLEPIVPEADNKQL
ncbi:MAG: hypothetical protein ACRBHB_14590 [Arenicella sp.]